VITLRGNAPIVGYVLDETDTSLVVLTNEKRTVVRVDVTVVRSREICRLSDPHLHSDYPHCPD
jgi:hypothetical protein